MLPDNLDAASIRVLGALIEKELSTPDNYPLSLNALMIACNQSTNREPVMTLDESAVSHALDGLRRLSLVRSFQGIGSRVPKFQHLLEDAGDLSPNERAVLCVLSLRAPQTLGEIRTRALRLMPNEHTSAVDTSLEVLSNREPPVVAQLARRPGQKEVRFAHLLGGRVAFENEEIASPAPVAETDRITALEELTRELQSELADMRGQLDAFRKQFE